MVKLKKRVFDCGTTNSQMAIDGRDKDLESEYSHREMSLAGMSDRRTRLRLRLATPQSKPKHSNPPYVTIWDALVVGVGFIQLIGSLWEHAASHSNNAPVIGTVAAAAQQQKGLLPYFWNYLKAIFHLLRIFGPLVYLRNSADEFKREMIVGERNYDDDNKHARRTKNTYHLEQEVATTATRQKQRQKSSLLSRSNFLCCRRELVAAAAVGSAAVLSVVSAICKLLLLSSDGVMVVEKSHLSDCAVALESASVHMYLVSAILTLWKSPHSWYSGVESIEALGDTFFGAASVVDVCLQHSNVLEGSWCIVSAFLWTCSSWFYILAKKQRQYDEKDRVCQR